MSGLTKLGDLKVISEKMQRPVVGFAMQIFLSYENSHTPAVQNTIIDIGMDFQAMFPDLLTKFQRHDANRLSPFTRDKAENYYRALSASVDPEFDQFSIKLTDPDIPPQCEFGTLSGVTSLKNLPPCGGLTAHVPLRWVDTSPEACIALVIDWCNRLRPAKGAVGVAPVAEFGMTRSRFREIMPFRARFPGMIDLRPLYASNRVRDQIGTVGWLTILDTALIAALGGRDALAAALGQDITIHDWDNGILIQAGAPDDLGDRNQNRWPTALCRVNDVLRPIRFEDYPNTPMALFKVPEPLDAYEETLNWVRRLDDRV